MCLHHIDELRFLLAAGASSGIEKFGIGDGAGHGVYLFVDGDGAQAVFEVAIDERDFCEGLKDFGLSID
jgi:hypothetical protein